MGYFPGARDIRNLLAVAAMLRRLAQDAAHCGDENLYRTAAEALERRANQMAAGLPSGMNSDPAHLHVPVNLLV